MAIDDRPLQENRTIVVLPMDVDGAEWVKDEDGRLLPITSLKHWFEIFKPQVVIEGLKKMDGDDADDETLTFNSLKDFSPDSIQEQSKILCEINFTKKENEDFVKKINKSKKFRQLLGE